MLTKVSKIKKSLMNNITTNHSPTVTKGGKCATLGGSVFGE